MSELEIPESWAECRLENVVEFLDSKRRPLAANLRIHGPYPYYGANGLQGYHNAYIFDEPLILLAEDGGHFGSKTKDIAYRIEGKTWVNNHAHVLRTIPIFNSSFLLHYLRRYNVKPFVTGSTVPKLNQEKSRQIPISIPPLAEQRRIVTKIESTFKRIEAIEKAVERAEVLSRKMALAFLKTDGDVQSTVGDSYSERIERCKNGGQGLRRVGVSNEHGVVDLRIADDVNTTRYKLVQKGDIFYNPMRLNVGSLALYDGNEQAITSPDYVVVKPRGIECSWLLYSFLKSEAGLKEIAKKTKGSVRERVYFKSLSEIEFPILTQQSNTAARRSFETFTQMLNGFGLAKQQFKAINSSVLSLAFSGRLVPQDPSEGTGHQLLEQILTAKTNSDSTKAPSPRAKKRKSLK
ncbi:MAG: restriction endonuclease subunit S [Pseudomonadota bacterium]